LGGQRLVLSIRTIRITIRAMIVCMCHNISTGDIARAASGCCSFESLQDELLVGTACGACESCARDTYAELQPRTARVGVQAAPRAAAI
jgi:bacterioferritin-associated ferredoxin